MPFLGFLTKKDACAICGAEKNSLVGGMKKLSDGKICKDCRKKLSPYYPLSENLSAGEVRDHLAYREKNREALDSFAPTVRIPGNKSIFFADEAAQKFLISPGDDYRFYNADLFSFSDVLSVEPDIKRYSQGVVITDTNRNLVEPCVKNTSQNVQNTLDYDFSVAIKLNVPWMAPLTFCLGKTLKEQEWGECSRCAEAVAKISSMLSRGAAVPGYQRGREARNKLLDKFRAAQTLPFADGYVMVDPALKCFVIGATADPRKGSDVMMFSDILSMDIREVECSRELKAKDENGREASFDPPRYETTLWYECIIYLKNSWTDRIDLIMSPYAVPVGDSLKYRETIARLYLLLGQDTSQFSEVYVESLFAKIRKLNGTLLGL